MSNEPEEELDPDLTDYLEQTEVPAKEDDDTQNTLQRIKEELSSTVRLAIETFGYDDTSEYAYDRIADHIWEAFDGVLQYHKKRNRISDYLIDVSVSQGLLMADAYIKTSPDKDYLRFSYHHNLATNEFVDSSFEQDG